MEVFGQAVYREPSRDGAVLASTAKQSTSDLGAKRSQRLIPGSPDSGNLSPPLSYRISVRRIVY